MPYPKEIKGKGKKKKNTYFVASGNDWREYHQKKEAEKNFIEGKKSLISALNIKREPIKKEISEISTELANLTKPIPEHKAEILLIQAKMKKGCLESEMHVLKEELKSKQHSLSEIYEKKKQFIKEKKSIS